jgi:hypothetical protein
METLSRLDLERYLTFEERILRLVRSGVTPCLRQLFPEQQSNPKEPKAEESESAARLT